MINRYVYIYICILPNYIESLRNNNITFVVQYIVKSRFPRFSLVPNLVSVHKMAGRKKMILKGYQFLSMHHSLYRHV